MIGIHAVRGFGDGNGGGGGNADAEGSFLFDIVGVGLDRSF